MFEAVQRIADSFLGLSQSPKPSQKRSQVTAVAPPSHAQVPTPPSRKRIEVEADIAHWKEKLNQVTANLTRERDYAQASGSASNHEIIAAIERRLKWTRDRLGELAAELNNTRESPRARPSILASTPLAKTAARPQIDGGNGSLAQAAKSALRKGPFPSSSTRAIFEKLAADLKEGRPDMQVQVLERIGELECIAGLPVFEAAARHASEEVRIASTKALLPLRHQSTRPVLLQALRDPSHRVRVWAVRGLYGLSGPDVGQLLCQQLSDSHPLVRCAALTYLGWSGFKGSERQVIRRLHDDSPEVRISAAHAIGQCGTDRAVFKLMVALQDDIEDVRLAAHEALKKLLGDVPAFDATAEGDTRVAEQIHLKTWWRAERVKRTMGPKESVDMSDNATPDADTPTADVQANDGPEDSVSAVENSGSGEKGEDDSHLGDSKEAGLDDDSEASPDGLDAETDIGGLDDDFGDADAGFATAEEEDASE